LTNLNYNAILNPPAIISFNTPATFSSTLNISGNTTLNNATTCRSSLNVSGAITASGNKLNLPNTPDQYKINLWGTKNYGFGVAASTLQYSSQGTHSFYNKNNSNTFTIDSSGNTSCIEIITASNSIITNTINNSLVSYFHPTPYNNVGSITNQTNSSINLCCATTVGFANVSPYLSVECCDIANNFGTKVFFI
jgi:hypothetical protein